jgi:RecA-family ATPase
MSNLDPAFIANFRARVPKKSGLRAVPPINRAEPGEAPEIITRRASDIAPEPISWLWKYWLARGKLHIIGGVPETGKTTIALSYAAIISSGATWPDGTRSAVGNVLIWTSEDSPADTLVPRLMRMGADRDRIHFIEQARPASGKPRPFNPATDMPALVAKAEAIGGVVLLILDPVVAVMPMTRNSHNNAESRNGMQPVVDFAEAADIAVVGIGHLTKGTAGKDPLERLNGSGAFGALPRVVMGAAKNGAEGDGDRAHHGANQVKHRAKRRRLRLPYRHGNPSRAARHRGNAHRVGISARRLGPRIARRSRRRSKRQTAKIRPSSTVPH